MKKPYRYIDHTADLGIEVRGKTLSELFENIGKAMFQTQISGSIKVKKRMDIELESESIEELFIDWCRELIYNFSLQGFIPKKYTISIKKLHLRAHLSGENFDPRRHKMRMEIKNATYHNFSIERIRKNYRARIIFDV